MDKKAVALAFTLALLFSAIAILSLFPPAFLSYNSTESPAQPTGPYRQFDADVVYTYVGPTNDPGHSHFDMPVYPNSLYPSVVYFNFTHVSSAETESCDAKMEVYVVEISTDTGCIENFTYAEGTNYDPSVSDLGTMSLRIDDFADPFTINGSSAGFSMNWTTGTTLFGGRIGTYGSYGSDGGGLGLWSNGEPGAITVSVRRVGWITLNGNSTSTTFESAETTLQVKLEKYGDGFLYNKMVPEGNLSQIDLFNPFT